MTFWKYTKTKLCGIWSRVKRLCNWLWIRNNDQHIANVVAVIALLFIWYQIIEANKQAFISTSSAIFQLGDRCMWTTRHGGDYNSYQFLSTLAKEEDNPQLLKAVFDQITRVNDEYKNKDVRIKFLQRLPWVCREGTKCEDREDLENEHDPSLENLINLDRVFQSEPRSTVVKYTGL